MFCILVIALFSTKHFRPTSGGKRRRATRMDGVVVAKNGSRPIAKSELRQILQTGCKPSRGDLSVHNRTVHDSRLGSSYLLSTQERLTAPRRSAALRS
jgi:hypothetical protein